MTAAPDRCRKCDAPRPRADQACPRCGLAPEHAEAWAARASLAPTGSLEAAWAEAEAAWEDPAAHERASAAALATNDFAWLAARYRAVLRARPADAIATYRLELLGKRAAAALTATADPRGPGAGKRMSLIPVAVAVAAIAAGTIYAAYVTRQRVEATGRRRPVEPAVAPHRTAPAPAIAPGPGGR